MYLKWGVLLFWLGVLWNIIKQKISLEWNSHTILLLCFLSIITISSFFSIDLYDSIYGAVGRKEGLIAWLCYGSIFFFSFLLLKIEDFHKVIFGLICMATLVSIYAILQHFHLDPLTRAHSLKNTDRSFGFFGNPNFYGSYITLMLPITMGMYMTTKLKWTTLMYLFANAVLFTSLLFSLTRSAWIGSFIAFLFLSIYFLRNKRLLKRWSLLFMTLTFVYLAINITEHQTISNRSESVFTEGKSALEGNQHAGSSRLYIWKQSLPLIPTYFWFGSGPDTFAEVFPDRPEEKKKYFHRENIIVDKAHNEFLQIAVTMGVPALLLYLLFIGKVLKDGYKAIQYKSLKQPYIILSIIGALIGYLTQSLFNISVISVAPFFWLLLGILSKFTYSIKMEKNLNKPE